MFINKKIELLRLYTKLSVGLLDAAVQPTPG